MYIVGDAFDVIVFDVIVGGTAAASPPPKGIGNPAVCGSQPLVTRFLI